MTTFKVNYNGNERTVEAKSARQAKFLAGINGYGLGGQDLTNYMKNPKVKVRRI